MSRRRNPLRRHPRPTLTVLWALAAGVAAAPHLAVARAQPPAPPVASVAVSVTIDLSTPEKTVNSLAATIAAGDWDDAVRCVAGAMPSDYTAQMKTEPFPPMTAQVTGFEVQSTRDDTAVVSFTAKIQLADGKSAMPERIETLTLHKGAPGWQIVPMDPRQFKPKEAGILTSVSLLLAYPEVALRTRQKARDAHAEEEEKQNPEHLQIGETGILALNDAHKPVFVGTTQQNEEAYSTYRRLQELRTEHPNRFTKADDGFTDAEYKATFTRAKSRADKLIASGDVRWLPHGTLVKIVDHVLEKGETERYALVAKESGLEFAQDPTVDNRGTGIWKVEVLTGIAKGKTVWTYDAGKNRPSLGDAVKLHMPDHPNDAVLAGIDEDAGRAILTSGQAASGAGAEQMARLRSKNRVLALPAGQPCIVDDFAVNGEGTVMIVIPSSGPHKGKRLYIVPADAVMTPP